MYHPKIYQLSITEAAERNEMGLFRASHKINVDCKNAIETAIREDFGGMYLNKGCLQPVLGEFGAERVNWVLANTVQQKGYDGRFSKENKEWAKIFPIPESNTYVHDPRLEYIVESHPAVLDGFISLVRREQAAEKKRPEKTEGRPSIREQLGAPSKPGSKPQALDKDREVR